MMDDGGQVTLGALNGIGAAALATMPACVLAALRGSSQRQLVRPVAPLERELWVPCDLIFAGHGT
jgi:hypothetical protein